MTSAIRRGTCRHCHEPIIWGKLQNGRIRSMDPTPVPPSEAAPADAFAFSLGLGVFVDLVGARTMPVDVLTAHYCREYAEARLMANVERLGDVDLDQFANTDGRSTT